jgi:uncharacterized protein (TIGR00255 family)
MIRSMTGYGEGTAELPGLRVTVGIRSVNNRFADLRLRLPPEWIGLEPELRRRILARVRRGRVEMVLNLDRSNGSTQARLNRPLADAVAVAAQSLRDEYGATGSLDLATLLSIPGMIQNGAAAPGTDAALREAIDAALGAALMAFESERLREGEGLRKDLVTRLERMESMVAAVDSRARVLPELVRRRLSERVRAFAEQVAEIDPGRLAQEIAFLVDRSDVTEELVRLGGHLCQARTVLAHPDGEPVGKRLDFLLQEIGRETNTVGSKASDLEISRLVLELKGEAEKVREQVQNLE